MSLTIHHLHHSQSERIVWLCEELRDLVPEFQYELVVHDRDPTTATGPRSLLEIHPAGTAPIMIDEVAEPRVVLAESGAIIEYLIHVYGQDTFSVAPGASQYTDYLYWYNFTNGTFQACLTQFGSMNFMVKSWKNMQASRKADSGTETTENVVVSGADDLEAMAARFQVRLGRYLNNINEKLGHSQYLAGDWLTAADIMIMFSLTTMRGFYPYSLAEYENILRYLGDISQRPAYRRALHRAEPGLMPMVGAVVNVFDYAVCR